mmetsp:Transcript_6982/g.16676  ORF Transcript_6982/g.16676 Transcript_6982/m.16676 type:complete len:282 (-) Transcript_6982:59-904(-)|eukprot:CAMPEP_0185801952 /NCGR_PEP_ID=MMETSP1322-20130828/1731_1 /TAXON_ID=265543 /ORGANISM="Minutocellus polymorphus, Strain RCC2270" /LENGTH=281 /DNA_ID=CAMNT_0028497683 /DNA_START=12 /DNA_END=857 /DNA_ORIENTATION=-
MNVQPNTTRGTNEAPPPPPGRRSSSEHIEVVLRATQDLVEREDRAAGKLPTETANTTGTTKHESSKTGVADNQQDKRGAVAKSADDLNTATGTTLPLTSTVRDDHSTQSDEKQEHTVSQNSDGKQKPDKPSEDMEHKTTAGDDDVISFEGDLGQPVPSSGGGSGWRAFALSNRGDLVDEDEEEQQRRRANFAAQRHRHALEDSLQAHYDAILADVFAAAEFDDDEEQQEQEQPQQDNNNKENTTAFHQNATRPERHHLAVAMDLFMQMETDDEELDESESE